LPRCACANSVGWVVRAVNLKVAVLRDERQPSGTPAIRKPS
jgi:hypothetical protein